MSISTLITQLAILFIMMFTGFGLNKVGILGEAVDQRLTKLVLQFTMPLTVLSSVLNNTGERDISMVLKVFGIGIGMYVILPLLALIFVRLFRIPQGRRGLYQYMFIFGNVGFMGFPIIEALFGAEAVLYAGAVNIIFNLASFSYGAYKVSTDGSERSTLGLKTFLSPGISLSVLAIIIYFLGIKLPIFIVSPVTSFGSLTTPLAMLLIGSTIAKMDAKSIIGDISVYIFVLVRFLILPILAFPLIHLVIKDEFLLSFTMIMITMPVANSAVLFAKQYKADDEYAAKSVFISTILSIITIPVMSLICLQ